MGKSRNRFLKLGSWGIMDAEHLSKQVSDFSGRAVGTHAGIVKAFPDFSAVKGLVQLVHVGVVSAEPVFRAVAAEDDVSGFGVHGGTFNPPKSR